MSNSNQLLLRKTLSLSRSRSYEEIVGMSVLLVVREEEHKDGLVNLGLQIAAAKELDLFVLQLSEAHKVGLPELKWEESQGLQCANLETANTERTIKDAILDVNADMLVIHDAADHTSTQKNVVNDLMQHVACEVMVVRLGERLLSSELGKILVPCSGGRHSRVALRLATKMTASKETTALFVEPDVDEVSESVGFAHLHRYVNRAGVSLDDIRCHIELEDDPFYGIRKEAERGDYGLMIIGASGHSSVRKKLFGTLPEKLMKGEDGMSVGVIRAARPISDRFKDKVERILHLNVPQLKRDERVALFDEVEEKARWSFDFAVLMVLATSIAALGLLADSGAVVIGAMLVAPLMMPLLGGGLSIVQGNWPLWKRCQKAVLLGFLSALAIGGLMGIIARVLDMPLTSQLAARGEPSILDLGVAFVSGIAASYCLARPKLSGALAGVAIAAALVPPIATTGICLATGEFSVAQGAALLFGTNVVAIVIGAAANFFIAGIRGKSRAAGVWSQRFFIVFALCMAGLIVPLSSALISRIAGPVEVEKVLRAEASEHQIKITKVLRGGYEDGKPVLEITLESAQPLSEVVVQALKKRVEEEMGEKVKLKVRTLLVGEW